MRLNVIEMKHVRHQNAFKCKFQMFGLKLKSLAKDRECQIIDGYRKLNGSIHRKVE